jgi:imidazoleglycerol-phosphate dehydratase/histidinol-phosphatase
VSQNRILFVAATELSSGTPDEQVDATEKLRFMPGVFDAMRQARAAGFRLVMVTNQDGLGSASFPQADFDAPHQFMLDVFSSQGVEFEAGFVCPHRKTDGCDCRKPKTKLVEGFVREQNVDLAGSAMVGDRDTDLEFAANLGFAEFAFAVMVMSRAPGRSSCAHSPSARPSCAADEKPTSRSP